MTPSATEAEPLLPRDRSTPEPPRRTTFRLLTSKCIATLGFLCRQDVRLLICIFLAFTLNGFAAMLLDVPILRLFEQAVCRDYYQAYPDPTLPTTGVIDEKYCKLVPIQSDVATLMGWKAAFDSIPGLLTAIFFGSLADKYGRKLVLLLSFTGPVLGLLWLLAICYFHNIFPIKLVWLSSGFLFLGGGTRVFYSMIYSMLADAVVQSERTKFMYFLTATTAITSSLAPPVGVWLMRKSIWLPFELAILLFLACYPFMLAAPETWKPNYLSQLSSPAREQSTLPDQNIQQPSPMAEDEHPQEPALPKRSTTVVLRKLRVFLSETFKLFLIPNLLFCFTIFFVKAIAISDSAFVLQYTSKRLGWELSQTILIVVIGSVGSFLATGIILPVFSSYAIKVKKVPAQRLDFGIVKTSLLVLTLGYFCVSIATNPIALIAGILITEAGSGVEPALESLMASFVARDHTARAFTTVQVLETTGKILGSPLMAKLFSIGLREGSLWTGLCFLVSSVLFAYLTITAWRHKLER